MDFTGEAGNVEENTAPAPSAGAGRSAVLVIPSVGRRQALRGEGKALWSPTEAGMGKRKDGDGLSGVGQQFG